MSREEIIRMAQEAGAVLADGTNAPPYYAFYPSELERFYSLVAAAKKEECAKVCEVLKETGRLEAYSECAAAIRALP